MKTLSSSIKDEINKSSDIINSIEFYFQKGRDALNKWLDIHLSKDTEDKILELASDYRKLQQEALNNAELNSILELLYEIISYCDVNARDKRRYNKYEDIRSLAKASVRMNTWIEKLILLKFSPDTLGYGSAQNAFNYLLKPIDNVTILSENHREVISKNILNKDKYVADSFVINLKEFFKQFNLDVVNEENYTYLISRIMYNAKTLWLDKEMDEYDNVSVISTDNLLKSGCDSINQILYGPPGTGKTFTTINKAIKIIDPSFYERNKDNRAELKKRFNDLLIKDFRDTDGRISFCTFHQSMTYEDFIEGIKPYNSDDKLCYKIENGIFKEICRIASDSNKSAKVKNNRLINWTEDLYNKANFFKLSLGDSTNIRDNEIYEYCIDNNCISMGFGRERDFSNLDRIGIEAKCKEENFGEYNITALDCFINKIQVGDFVIIGKGNNYVRAIGKVVSDYKYDLSTSIRYSDFRDVEWLFVNEEIPIKEIYHKALSQQTIYKLDKSKIIKDFFVAVDKGFYSEVSDSNNNYVLIIDEINRGNVSQIFGELITLIEKDKRTGADEELELMLPYSKESFSVPSNLHIVGTMNTADRSVEALDTALRRRFEFIEMSPKPNLIRTDGKLRGDWNKIEGINLVSLLEIINKRIEKLIDKDHMIGHSYFMSIENIDDLKSAFQNNIIPLLQEYFYGDYAKIGLVLGKDFFINEGLQSNNTENVFADFNGFDKEQYDRPIYRLLDVCDMNFNIVKAINTLLGNNSISSNIKIMGVEQQN